MLFDNKNVRSEMYHKLTSLKKKDESPVATLEQLGIDLNERNIILIFSLL